MFVSDLEMTLTSLLSKTTHPYSNLLRNTVCFYPILCLADIFQKPVMLSESGADASVLGAVQMGRKAMGLPENIENEAGRVVGPAPDKAEIYADVFRRFKSLVAKR